MKTKYRLWYIYNRIIKKLRGSAYLNSHIDKTTYIGSGSTIINSSFDRHSYCGYDCTIIHCTIGSFTSIANRITIGGAHHKLDNVSLSPFFENVNYYSKTTIGNDVWIGEGSFIKGGISIGSGAVIGMGSVVTKDIPPYTVYAGNPAKFIRTRFNDEIIQELLSIEWWKYTDDVLHEKKEYFNDIDMFLKKFNQTY